jgi:hypothetical protein
MTDAKTTAASGARDGKQARSALGVGVTTLITILMVMLLAAFAVLSLATARSDDSLTQLTAKSVQAYYEADSEAAEWYANLDGDVKTLEAARGGLAPALAQRGYSASEVNGEVLVSKSFPVGDTRLLTVVIAVLADGTTSIRQWQTTSVSM